MCLRIPPMWRGYEQFKLLCHLWWQFHALHQEELRETLQWNPPVWQTPLNFGHWCVSVQAADKIPLISRQLKKEPKIILIDLPLLKRRGFVFNISDKKIVSFCCRTFQSVLHTPLTSAWGSTALINHFSCSSQIMYQQSSTCVFHYETLTNIGTVATQEKTQLQLLKQGWMESAHDFFNFAFMDFFK